MLNLKYKARFKTDFSKGECDGEVQAESVEKAAIFVRQELAKDLMIDEAEIIAVDLTSK